MTAPLIPGFAFIEHLGSGGFADVFLYEQQWPHQRVAVKVVRPDIPLTTREKQLFTAEANAMARLADHPYIVSVITAGITHDGRPYLVMRYCPPPDLGVRVRSNPMPVRDAVATGIKLASAIETAHRSGILHRDIKPSNVLITTYHEPALTDFGIAGQTTDVDSDSDVRISYPWSPPEMLDGSSNGSVASDVYSLGATIWHLLVGRSPFSIPAGDNSTRALSARILHAAAPATQRPDVPIALDRLLQQCLAKRPEQRPHSALDLARALQRIEESAKWPRTMVAVEGDQPDTSTPTSPTAIHQPAVPPQDSPNPRQSAGVFARSAPRPVAVESAQTPDTAKPASRIPHALWLGFGAVLVGVLVAIIVANGGRTEEDPGVVAPSVSHTPDPLIPDVLTHAPTLSGSRTSRGAEFRWNSRDELEPGDQWLWNREDNDDFGRTTRRRLIIDEPGRICLSVRLERGNDQSPSTRFCVS